MIQKILKVLYFYNKIIFITWDIKNMATYDYTHCETLTKSVFKITFYKVKTEYILYVKYLFE